MRNTKNDLQQYVMYDEIGLDCFSGQLVWGFRLFEAGSYLLLTRDDNQIIYILAIL